MEGKWSSSLERRWSKCKHPGAVTLLEKPDLLYTSEETLSHCLSLMTSLGPTENIRQNSKKLKIAIAANMFLEVLNFVVLSHCAWYLANPVPQAKIFISIPIYLQ